TDLQATLFTLCTRQMTLSTSVGKTTFHRVPALAAASGDEALLKAILEVATEIAKRSAKHSTEFLEASNDVSLTLKGNPQLTARALALAEAFAVRAGGI